MDENKAALMVDGKEDSEFENIEYTTNDWETTDTIGDELTPGDSLTFNKTFSHKDVELFARITGDTNQLHLNEDAASESMFGERIVHGMLASSLISAALARLPGSVIYLSQDLEFIAPLSLKTSATATVEIAENLGDDKYRLTTIVTDDANGTDVITGEAVVLIESSE